LRVEEKGCNVLVMQVADEKSLSSAVQAPEDAPQTQLKGQPTSRSQGPMGLRREDLRRNSVDMSSDVRFTTPLTSMFKRSSSAPASNVRDGTAETFVSDHYLASRRHSVCSVASANTSRDTTASPPVLEHEVRPRADNRDNATGNAASTRDNVYCSSLLQPSPLALTSTLKHGGLGLRSIWTDTSSSGSPEPSLYSPTLPAFVPDVDDNSSPIHSPITSPYDITSEGDYVFTPVFSNGPGARYVDSQYVEPYSSYSSLNGWCGDGLAKYPTSNYSPPYEPMVVTPQSPVMYDPERVMKDAFEAASFAPFDIFGHGVFQAQAGYTWGHSDDNACLQHYDKGVEDIGRRHGDQRQLFNCNPVSAY